ncbi:outer envelope pore protein 16, chloroplastic isoform X3 [Herrania umbratica]|uniref:Outer envelope pore protein 16, chloroplastic isoform X3 n=1 Tax=Herrania umbratica TaxID=108875 RepID=A0A6J0ZX42_9ROSI|nr:outer envelope pore protein 16, chloroplastic isoform X3 [Herrania umbratica]
MPSSMFSGSLSAPSVNVTIDTGNPFLNQTVDGFLKIGTVAATRAVAEDTFTAIKRLSQECLEHALKRMCKEGAYWGSAAGVYVGMEYGVGRIRGSRDWKNAMIGGALTGALVSAVSNNNKDRIVTNAFTGGAIATASVFLNNLT